MTGEQVDEFKIRRLDIATLGQIIEMPYLLCIGLERIKGK
jgi:hypothetical protein